MKILAIRGRNLASLAREFDVDLTADELGQSGIFAICGPVGAGKSTLLDALCLALFDRTPRLSGRGGVAVAELDRPETHWLHSHDPRSLLRRGAGEGHAEVDFTGRDGRRYRARWSVRRARRRGDGRVQQQEMSLEDLDRRIVVARANKSEVLLAIRARLGLDYGQFCRSVLLAQGQFAAFLRASADERAGLLESLTGADVYRRLSRAAHERRKLEQVEIDKLRAQVRGIELLDDGNRAGLEGEVTAMTEQVRVNQLAVDLAQSYVSWYASAAKLRNEESRATAALQLTIAANRAAAARRARLAELRCALPLVPRLELVAQCQQRVVTAVAAERALEAEVEVAEHELARHREARTAALRREFPGAASPPPVVVEFERWRAPLLRWGRLEAEWQRLGPPDGETGAALAAATARLEVANAALETPEFAALPARRRRLVEARATLARQVRCLHELERSGAEARRAADEVAARAAERDRLAEGFEQLTATQRDAERALAAARREFERVRAHADLAGHRAELAAGEPCPLCGATEHAAAGRPGDEAAALAAAREAVAGAEAARELARDAITGREAERRNAERALQSALAVLAAAEARQAPARNAWLEVADELAATAGAVVAIDPDDIVAAVARLGEQEAALTRGELELAELADRRDLAHAEVHAAAESEGRARDAMRLAADLAEVLRELAPGFDGIADWEPLLRKLGVRAERVFGEVAAIEGRFRAAAATVAAHRERLASSGGELARTQAELAEATAVLAAAVKAARVSPTAVREAAELGAEAVHAQEEELRELEQAEGRARAVLQKCAEIRKRHEDTDRPAILEDDAAQALEDSRAARDAAGEVLDERRTRLAADDLLRRQRAEIEPRLRRAEERFEVWASLDDLIGHSRGDTFAVFAQGLTLELLLIEANRRLAELAGRYRLERNRGRDMDFIVVDLDLGGARRGLQSLSGGETFLVSLALALALATLAAPRSRVETLFLDEGFGTLDAQHLEAALGALDSLQASGCQIGVISHVEGIAERIGTVVDIVPEGGGQSRVRVRA